MKPIKGHLLALCMLLLIAGVRAQGDSINVLFQSSAGAFTGAAGSMSWWSGVQSVAASVDLNNNGSLDIPVILSQDPPELGVIDGVTGQMIWNMTEVDLAVIDPDSFVVFRIREVTETGTTAILGYVESGEFRYHLIDVDSKQQEPGDWDGLGRLIWADGDFNGDGFVDMLFVDILNASGVITVLSVFNDSIAGESIPPPVNDASSEPEVVLKFESGPSSRLPLLGGQFFTERSIDFNQDNIADLVIIREDPQDGSLRLTVRNMQTGDVMWAWDIPDDDEDIAGPFHGFHDVNANGAPEAYFGERVFVNQQNEVSKLPEGFVIVGFQDIDDDGFEDLWGYRKQDSVVQIWGASETSAIHESDRASGLQLAVRPNLFSGSTTIHFHLEQSGSAMISIHDLSGQLITTVFRGTLARGTHQHTWNARAAGLPSGLYLMTLVANGEKMSQQVVLME